ncbi:MAG: hypothetical protein ACXIUO_02205 [Erythrobacter sp.]
MLAQAPCPEQKLWYPRCAIAPSRALSRAHVTLTMSAVLIGPWSLFDLQKRPFELEKTLFANGCGLSIACVV